MCKNLTANPNSKGWEHSFRYFKLLHAGDKTNGTYISPLFSGNYLAGHWMLAVIQRKDENKCEGWILDTLQNNTNQRRKYFEKLMIKMLVLLIILIG